MVTVLLCFLDLDFIFSARTILVRVKKEKEKEILCGKHDVCTHYAFMGFFVYVQYLCTEYCLDWFLTPPLLGNGNILFHALFFYCWFVHILSYAASI